MDDPPPPLTNTTMIESSAPSAQHERDLNRQINQAGVEGPGAGVSCGDAESGGLAAVDESGPPFSRRELRVAQVALLRTVRVREARQLHGMVGSVGRRGTESAPTTSVRAAL